MICRDVYKCNTCSYEEYRPHKLVLMDFKCPKCKCDLKKVDTLFLLYLDPKI